VDLLNHKIAGQTRTKAKQINVKVLPEEVAMIEALATAFRREGSPKLSNQAVLLECLRLIHDEWQRQRKKSDEAEEGDGRGRHRRFNGAERKG
jgi:hypothetical protein